MNELEKIEVDLKLTVAHINTILAHLAKGAYSEVVDLINHLRGQAVPQVQAASNATNSSGLTAVAASTDPAAAPAAPAAPEAPEAPAAPAA